MKCSPEAIIDTNVLIYDTFSDSIYHESAAPLLDELEKWHLPIIVVYEYVWFMKGLGLGARAVHDKVIDYTADEKAVFVWEGINEVLWALEAVSSEGLSRPLQ